MNSSTTRYENPEALITIGQVVLHYRYYRQAEDTFKDWYVGMASSSAEYEKEDGNHKKSLLFNVTKLASFRMWRIDCKKTAAIIFEKLMEKGFLPDLEVRRGSEFSAPLSQCCIYVFRRDSN